MLCIASINVRFLNIIRSDDIVSVLFNVVQGQGINSSITKLFF